MRKRKEKKKRGHLQRPGAVQPWEGGSLPLFLGLASTLLPIKVVPKLSHSAPWSPLQSQGGAGRGWGDRSGAWGPAGFISCDFGVGWGKEIKGFSLNHYSENTLQSVRAHSRGSCQEAPPSTGRFASQIPLQLWECPGTNVSRAGIVRRGLSASPRRLHNSNKPHLSNKPQTSAAASPKASAD